MPGRTAKDENCSPPWTRRGRQQPVAPAGLVRKPVECKSPKRNAGAKSAITPAGPSAQHSPPPLRSEAYFKRKYLGTEVHVFVRSVLCESLEKTSFEARSSQQQLQGKRLRGRAPLNHWLSMEGSRPSRSPMT